MWKLNRVSSGCRSNTGLNSRFARRNGQILIRDVQKPTTVIEGEQRCLTSAEQGENSEWLYIPTEYMGKGERLWHFNVMVTHGDSFINPLYRIFPVTQQIRRSYVINLAQDVSDDEK